MTPDAPFSLGPWLVDPAANEVRRDDAVVRLEPKAVAVLVHLARRPGEVVTRAELLDAVWPDVVVTDASLTRCVSQLRQAFGDDARETGLIETIPTVGYRLHPPAADPAPPAEHAPRTRRWSLAVLGLAAVAGLTVAPVLWHGPSGPVVVEYRVEVAGEVEDARVTTTGPDGASEAEAVRAFPFTKTVEAGDVRSGTFRLQLQGRSAETAVTLAVVVRRGDEVLAEHMTTGTTEADSLDAFSFYALARFGG